MPRVLVVLFLLPTLLSAEARLLRHPSYHQGKVAFSYLGDIWVAVENGGAAQRLTVHKARDVYPRFSPDGKRIAFSSNRYGNYDVFVIPAEGGQPKQLTFHTGNDIVVGWTPDSNSVIFQAARGRLYPGIMNLYEVPIEGKLEQPIPTDWGYWGSYSPEGARFAFVRHPATWWRKHYRGSYAADLWVMDVASKKFTKLEDDEYKGNSHWPMYGANGEIYFVADRLASEKGIKPASPEVMKSVNNIWKISDRGGRPAQVTHHTSGNLFFPSISSDGRTIVYELDFGLWKLDTATGKSTPIKINIASDEKENNIETLVVQNEAESFHLSPSTKRAAIATHGEIFTVPTDRGEVLRVTESYSREKLPQWSPDGKWIAFVSDRSGREEAWISDEHGKNLKKLSDSDTDKQSIAWAPDSKSLLYAASDQKLYRVELENGKIQQIASSEAAGIQNAHYSPDGAWISYTKYDRNIRPHVYVVGASGGQEHHIGRDDSFSESSARWAPDGKKLIFLSGVMQGGISAARQSTLQLFSVSLEKEEKNPADRGVDEESEAPTAAEPERPRAGARPENQKVVVKIDWDGLARRVRQITRLSDSVAAAAPSPDSRLYAFVAIGQQEGRQVSTLYTVQENGERVARVTQSESAAPEAPPRPTGPFGGISSLQFSKDGRTLFFQERNGIYAAEIGSGAGAAPAAGPSRSPAGSERRRVTFTARVEVDHQQERRQVFNESWRVMKNTFYDPNMHGVDWAKMRSLYEPLIDFASDQEQMHDVILEMIGELNASHTGISAFAQPGEAEERQPVQTRYPGFEMDAGSSGYYRVSYVYKDGPADKDYVKIAPGDFILAINDHDLKAGDNYWKFYNAVPGRKFEFTVNSKPSLEGAWKTKVEPVSNTAFGTLQYEKWVAEKKRLVEELSRGEIGYLHIRQMNAESLRKFERDLVENHFKKALIIDQRFNPGGAIDQELLQILSQRQYQRTRLRGSLDVTRPDRAFFGPMVVMQNERSTSDAEVFPDGFRTLGLGKLVGVPTYGAVIGTGSHRLLDGSSLRTPATGLWNIKGYNLENYGVPPDVYVDNSPDDFLRGRDAQIEKAIEVLREDLKKGNNAGR